MFKLFRMKRFVMLEEIFVPQDEHLTEEKEMQEMLQDTDYYQVEELTRRIEEAIAALPESIGKLL